MVWRFTHHFRLTDAPSCLVQQTMTRNPKIVQRKQGDHLPGVFLESAIANYSETELMLDHPKWILSIRTDGRQHLIRFLLLLSQFSTLGIYAWHQNGQSIFAGKVVEGAFVLVVATISEDSF